MSYNSWIYKYLMVPVSMILASVKWDLLYYFWTGRKHALTLDDLHKVNEQMMQGRYILLSRRATHLTTYFISLGNFILTGKWAYYSHAFVNTTKSTKRTIWDGQFLEATGGGVDFSAFDEVLNVDGVCVLQPKGVTEQEWGDALSKAINKHFQAPYDDLFRLKDWTALSCVELVLAVIMELPENKAELFQPFFDLINERKNLTPQMYYECRECFDLILEIRR